MANSGSDLPTVLGGVPIRPDGPPAWPQPDPDVQAALTAAIAAGIWGQYRGEHVAALEVELSAYHGVPHCLTCGSGTLAVEVALRALRVGPGDEVVMAAYDYESNFLSVHAVGARPVLVDVTPHNWNLDPQQIAIAISPQTRAILCSHLHGGLVPMREILAIARHHGIGLVEDAAQAPGATVQGRPAGTWGDVGTLSFGGSKLLCAGRGGALLFRDSQTFQRAKVWLHRGVQPWAPLSELQAAALRPQLAKLTASTVHRRVNARSLSHLPGLHMFENTLEDSSPAFYKVGFRYDAAAIGLPRELFVRAVRAEGMAFDVGFNALHVGRSPSRYRGSGELTNATQADAGCVVLHHPVLGGTADDIQQVVAAVNRLYAHRSELARIARE